MHIWLPRKIQHRGSTQMHVRTSKTQICDFNLQYLILQVGTNGLNSDNTADGRTLNVLISVHLHKFQKKDT